MGVSDDLRLEVRLPVVLGLSAVFGGSLFLAWYLGHSAGNDDDDDASSHPTAAAASASTAETMDGDDAADTADGEPISEASVIVGTRSHTRPAVELHVDDPSHLVVVDALGLRESPTTTAEVTTTVHKGSELTVLEQRGRWAHVRVREAPSATGWFLLPYTSSFRRAFGRAAIRGRATLTGTPPEMKVPPQRAESEFCKDHPIPQNAVLTQDGGLADVVVRLDDGQLEATYESASPATLTQLDCMYLPRVQVLNVEQELRIVNADPTLHNVNASAGHHTFFNVAQPKGAPYLEKSFDEVGVYTMQCDVHPWMRAFIVVTDHPFFAVSDRSGAFEIPEVPAGTYEVIAWHSQFGRQSKEVTVDDDGVVELDVAFDASDPPPPENPSELEEK